MLTRIRSAFLLAVLVAAPVAAETVQLKPGHPDSYVVVRGDTLWDISARFLQSPWRWNEVWAANPQIENPDLIFPGDVIELSYRDGRPVLGVRRGGERPTVKLSPEARVEPLAEAIPTIRAEVVRNFLTRTRPIDEKSYEAAPYVVSAAEGHLIVGGGGRFYARGADFGEDQKLYSLFRSGQSYRDPQTGDVLGVEAVYLGDAQLERAGDPASFKVVRAGREINEGDRLFPVEQLAVERDFHPTPPPQEVRGRVISVVDGLTQIGQYQVVVLDLGRDAGLVSGNVLAVYRTGETVRDRFAEETPVPVKLPDERSGLVLVFQVFDRISYALVTESQRPIHIGDTARNP